LDCPPQGVKLGAYWFGFYFLDEPVEAPFDFIYTGDSGFDQSIHHLAGGDYCVGKGWTV
jgi:hypothetical protein